MAKEESIKIKNRLSNIGEQIGELALNYINDLEKENEELKIQIEQLEQDKKALSNNVVSFGNIIKQKEKLWKYLESRFVEVCKTCTPEEKAKCVMFPEYCEGECKEVVDLFALIDKGESQVVS